jgi:aminopeptidase N
MRRLVAERLLLLVLVPFLLAARSRPVETHPPLFDDDPFSFSEPAQVTTRHIALDLQVDFAARQLRGSATLQIANLSGTSRLILDTSDLDVSAVSVDGNAATWTLGTPTAVGRPLTIDITPSTREVTIDYVTRPEAAGLHWMTAMQSYGRVSPYLYSQNEPDEARSWIPSQDTPTVRSTYEARIQVPAGLLALMSAENPTVANDSGLYTFRMDQPVPSYLIALAVGRLEFRSLDERTGVYAEPELLDDAAWELQFIPSMVDAAERVITPYPWGRYDVLLMPPTYIVGGMEHPRLNFINPFSVVTQNHPAAPEPSALIAHELAHAWAGDMTTLANWSDAWINEGITSYLTLRILEELAGPDRAEFGFFLDRSGYASYVADAPDPAATIMHHHFAVDEPAIAAFGPNAYTKGELFLKMLEDRIGRNEFDRFLRAYFGTFTFRSVDDRTFLSFLHAVTLAGKSELETSLKLEEWVYGPGLPSNVTAPTSSRMFDDVLAESSAFNSGKKASELALKSFTRQQIDIFVQLSRTAVEQRMGELDAAFGFSFQVTPPLQWLLATARTNYQPGMAAVRRVLERGGTNSAVQQIYFALSHTTSGKAVAQTLFQQLRDRYEPSVQNYVEHLLFPSSKRAA